MHCWFVTLMFILWIAHQLSIDLCKHHNVYNTYCLKFHLSFCKFQPKTLWSSVCSRDARPRDWSRLAAIFMVSVSPDISRDRRDWGQSILFHQLFFYFLYVLNWIVKFFCLLVCGVRVFALNKANLTNSSKWNYVQQGLEIHGLKECGPWRYTVFNWIPKHLRYTVFDQKPWRCTVFSFDVPR